jgi:putative peptidoglycan lipid II flippase
MSLLRSFATVASNTLVSRVLGFVRDILIAATLGAGTVADAFFAAFKLPNLFRRLFAEGAFNAAFVPMYARRREGADNGDGAEAAQAFADAVFTVMCTVLVLLVLVIEAGLPWLMRVITPGFAAVPGKLDLAIELTRITFPYILLISLVAMISGVLNSVGRFGVAAATPIILNLCLIGALLVGAERLETPGHALAWGVALAGLLQFLWVARAASKATVMPRLQRPKITPEVKTMLVRMIPGVIGAGVYQLNLVVDMIIATLVANGALSFLYFADRVTQLPLGVVGVAIGTALLPLLSRQLRAGKEAEAMHNQNRAIEISLLLTLPAAAALVVIPTPIVATLFEHGRFSAADTAATAGALAAFAAGLPAYVLIKVLAPGFFAREDTRTPVRIAIVALVANVILNLALMGPLGHVGVALATAISAWLNVTLLAVTLRRRGALTLDARLVSRLPRILGATVLMAVLLWQAQAWLDALLGGGKAERAAGLALLVGTGIAAYFVLAQLFGAAKVSEIRGSLRRQS